MPASGGGAGLTAEEIADLLAPGPAAQCERWIKPLASLRLRRSRRQRALRLKNRVQCESAMALSADAQRFAGDIMRLVNAQDERSFVELDQRVPGWE